MNRLKMLASALALFTPLAAIACEKLHVIEHAVNENTVVAGPFTLRAHAAVR